MPFMQLAQSWEAHRAQRARVRALRAELIQLCAGIREETPEYLALNERVSTELDRLPRWQRWSPLTDPTLTPPGSLGCLQP